MILAIRRVRGLESPGPGAPLPAEPGETRAQILVRSAELPRPAELDLADIVVRVDDDGTATFIKGVLDGGASLIGGEATLFDVLRLALAPVP